MDKEGNRDTFSFVSGIPTMTQFKNNTLDKIIILTQKFSHASAQFSRLWSKRNFCQRVPSNLITNIMAAIFDFNGSGRLGRVKIYTEGAVDGQE